MWDDVSGTLHWVEIHECRVCHLVTGQSALSTTDMGEPVGAVALVAGDDLVAATASGFAFICDGHVSLGPRVESTDCGTRMNDGKCDPRGRFIAGTMGFDGQVGQGALYGLFPDGGVQVLLRDVSISNGLDWTADGRTLYYIDSLTHRIDAFDYDLESAHLSNRRTVLEIPARNGLPDGLALDADGNLWVALFGGSTVHCYDPAGRLLSRLELPVTNVTSVTFGGRGYETLFVTSGTEGLTTSQRRDQPLAGSVFASSPGAIGRPPNRFGALLPDLVARSLGAA